MAGISPSPPRFRVLAGVWLDRSLSEIEGERGSGGEASSPYPIISIAMKNSANSVGVTKISVKMIFS